MTYPKSGATKANAQTYCLEGLGGPHLRWGATRTFEGIAT